MKYCFKYSDRCFPDTAKKELYLDETLFDFEVREKGVPYAVRENPVEKSGEYLCWIPKGKEIPVFPFLYAYGFKKWVEVERECSSVMFYLDPSLIVAVFPQVEGEKIKLYTGGEVEQLLAELFSSARPKLVVDVAGSFEENLKKFQQEYAIEDSPNYELLSATPDQIVKESLRYVKVPVEFYVSLKTVALVLSGIVLLGAGLFGYAKYREWKTEQELEKQREVWRPSQEFKRDHLAYLFKPTKEILDRAVVVYEFPPIGSYVHTLEVNSSGIKAIFLSPDLPKEGKKSRKELYRWEKVIPVSVPTPTWESLRYKPKLTIPKFTDVASRWSFALEESKQESVGGYPVQCATVKYSGNLSPVEVDKLLKLLDSTPVYKIDKVLITLNRGLYRVDLLAEVCGRTK